MNILKKYTTVLMITGLFTTAVFAIQDETTDKGYIIQVTERCKVINEYAMTKKQINAYKALMAEEDKMKELEIPIADFQDEIDEYSQEIEALSALAIQETDDSLFIDKTYLAKQNEVVEKLNAVINEHQHEFDALGKQGDEISKLADAFTLSLRPTLGNLDNLQINIITPDSNSLKYQCYRGKFHINT